MNKNSTSVKFNMIRRLGEIIWVICKRKEKVKAIMDTFKENEEVVLIGNEAILLADMYLEMLNRYHDNEKARLFNQIGKREKEYYCFEAHRYDFNAGYKFFDYSDLSISIVKETQEKIFLPKKEIIIKDITTNTYQISIPEWLYKKHFDFFIGLHDKME